MSISLTGNDLTFEQLYQVAREGAEVSLAPAARSRMEASRAVIGAIVASNKTAYGVNTGFGDLA